MKKPDLPYVVPQKTKGKTYFYFRKGTFRHRLPDDPDTEEFSRAYWAIRSGKKNTPAKDTWANLITSYLATPAFKCLSDGTRANYRRHCDAIREKNGNKSVKNFRRKHALAARDALQDTWSKANERVAVLSILCKHAVDLEWINQNPVSDIPKLKGGEYKAWPASKLKAFEECCEVTRAHTARTIYELAIGTGQRIGDCIKMKWTDFDGEFMAVVQEKTGAKIWVYCPERLQHFIASLPKTGAYILAKNLTQPMDKRTVQKAVEEVRSGIGVMHGEARLVPHGWRYTAAKELAEAGCSDADIQSVTGHKTTTMAAKYRKQADQKLASKRAQQAREQNKHRT